MYMSSIPFGTTDWSAVARAANGCETTGAFLSGGLDSSAVAGMLAEVNAPVPARTFSVGFANEEYNELYVQATQELDPDAQLELFHAMNDLIISDVVEIQQAPENKKNEEERGIAPS